MAGEFLLQAPEEPVHQDEQDAAEPQYRMRCGCSRSGRQGLHLAEHPARHGQHVLAQRGGFHAELAADEQFAARDLFDTP
ncbi:hypothetical protein [Streptomyces griseosporeus]|uniref:hypothetical protein n=1 Tax=Streptomyces griseosporeus TaxID=1910 RepID=UPI003688BCAD